MKFATRLFVPAAVALAAFLAGTSYAHRSGASGGAAGRKILHWVDPMHPAYTSDKPGIAPDCGMQLEPVYADGLPAASGEAGPPRRAGTVALSADRQQLFGVRVAAAEKAPASYAVRLFGRVAADETRVFTVNAATDGNMRAVSGVSTGTRVRKGQWLGAFFSYDSRTPMQAYITALDVQDQDPIKLARSGLRVAAGGTADTNAQFTVERLRQLGMGQEQIEQIKRTRRIPLTIDIQSPADGFVISRNVSLGQKFDKGAEWFRIANLDRVWIVADVVEDDVRHVRPGMRATVAVPGRATTLAATVAEVLPQFDSASRTFKVRLDAENPGYLLRPDMFVDVALSVELPPAITVPADALVDAGTRRVVFVERGEGFFEPRDVEVGWRHADRVEIVRGVDGGERVVVSGTFLVDSESRLKAAASGVYGASVKDPVCGMDVDEARARAAGKTVQRGGKTYSFCSEQCQRRFSEAPEKFAGAPSHDHEASHHDHGTL